MHNRDCSYKSARTHRSNVSAALFISVHKVRDLLCATEERGFARYSHFIAKTYHFREIEEFYA